MPSVKEREAKEDLKSKIDALPPALLGEVEDFVDFVATKHTGSSEDRSVEREPMKLKWRGVLRDLEQSTSEKLQQEALEHWKKTAEQY